MIPSAGIECTIYHYSDRSTGTVERVSESGKTCWIRPDLVSRSDTNGMSESQRYLYTPDKDAKLMRASLRKNGQWVLTGFGNRVVFGFRDAYHDYTF